MVVEVGETRTDQCPLRDRLGIQNGPDSRVARPHPRAHGRNRSHPQVMVHPVCPS